MTGAIILAAGASTRLGQPKQNLIYAGKSLLQRTIEAAIEAACQPIAVVLGANYEKILPQVKDMPVHILFNSHWQQGLSTSIKAGLSTIQNAEAGVTDVILLLCDQPFVNASLLRKLIATKKQTGKGIVACSYSNTVGVPALFGRSFFSSLQSLGAQDGAKKLLLSHQDQLATISFPLGNIDIDTVENYQTLIDMQDSWEKQKPH